MAVKVGHIMVGGGAPIVVQVHDQHGHADVKTTLQQTGAGRSGPASWFGGTVNVPKRRRRCREIISGLLDAGCNVAIIGDFHYNGPRAADQYPDCAAALDKYRINPGNVGAGQRRERAFFCQPSASGGGPRQAVRIGVNGGSLNRNW